MKGGGCGIFDGIFKQFPCLFSRLDRSFVKDSYAFTSANHHTKRKYTQRPNHCLVEGGEKERVKTFQSISFRFGKNILISHLLNIFLTFVSFRRSSSSLRKDSSANWITTRQSSGAQLPIFRLRRRRGINISNLTRF